MNSWQVLLLPRHCEVSQSSFSFMCMKACVSHYSVSLFHQLPQLPKKLGPEEHIHVHVNYTELLLCVYQREMDRAKMPINFSPEMPPSYCGNIQLRYWYIASSSGILNLASNQVMRENIWLLCTHKKSLIKKIGWC